MEQFKREGIAAIRPQHGGGSKRKYTSVECERVLREIRHSPDPEKDGTKTWSLTLLRKALHKAEDGLPDISTERIWVILQEAGFRWQKSRSWCETGQVVRKRKLGKVMVTDPDATPQKELIETAYRLREKKGLAVWVEDEAGPYQTVPYPGESWQPESHPVR